MPGILYAGTLRTRRQSLTGFIKMLDQIFNEDCVNGMQRLPAKSAQVKVTSPPYNVRKPPTWTIWNTRNT